MTKQTSQRRQNFLGLRLTQDENNALTLWAKSEGLDKSSLLRRVFRMALHQAAPGVLPESLLTSLQIQQDKQCP